MYQCHITLKYCGKSCNYKCFSKMEGHINIIPPGSTPNNFLTVPNKLLNTAFLTTGGRCDSPLSWRCSTARQHNRSLRSHWSRTRCGPQTEHCPATGKTTFMQHFNATIQRETFFKKLFLKKSCLNQLSD